MTVTLRGVPSVDNGGTPPFDAIDWQNQVHGNVAALWGRSTCWLNSIAGTPSAVTAQCSPTETAYAKNKAYWFIPTADNPTAVTINIDGLGPRTLADAAGNGLSGGEAQAGSLYLLVDDGAQLRIVVSAGGQAGAGGSEAPDIILEDQKTPGTNAGTFSSGAWLVRDLTTSVRNNVAASSFSGNRITLPAGTYFARWSCPAVGVGVHQTRLYNETDASVVAVGSVERIIPGNGTSNRSMGGAFFSLGASKTLLLHHQCSNTAATTGFGQAGGLAVELYSRLEIWKVGQTDAQVSGVPGGALTFFLTFSSTTADADPGPGLMRLNNVAVGAATQVYLDNSDYYLNDITAVLASIATSSSTTKAHLRLEKRGDATKWATYNVTGDSAPSGYHRFNLTYIGGAGGWANGDVLIARFDTVGDRGIQGAAGNMPKVKAQQTTPPGSPSSGDAYLVKPTGTGAWAGHDNQVATWNGSAWTFATPADDDLIWDGLANRLDYYDLASTSWKAVVLGDPKPEDYGAVGDGVTDDTTALQAFLNAVQGGKGVFTPTRTYGFNGRLFVRDSSRLSGYGSTLKALAAAGNNSSSLNCTDPTQGTAQGPGNVVIEGLTINGNATARRTAGSFSGVGGAGCFYAQNCAHLTWRDLTSIDSEGDAFYIGGDDTLGGRSIYFLLQNLYGTTASRNGIAIVGALRGNINACIMTAITFGAAHSNISVGYDYEPNGSTSQNEAITSEGCQAIGCVTEGFGFHNNVAYNNNINILSPYADGCGIGYSSGTAGVGARIIAARYKSNTTNFSNISESLASFP